MQKTVTVATYAYEPETTCKRTYLSLDGYLTIYPFLIFSTHCRAWRLRRSNPMWQR